MNKRICPNCGHNEFFADVVVQKIWKVNEDGVRLGVVDEDCGVCLGPENDENWICTECSTTAVKEMGKEELLDMMESLVKHLEEKGSIGESYRALCYVKKRMKNVLKFSGRKV